MLRFWTWSILPTSKLISEKSVNPFSLSDCFLERPWVEVLETVFSGRPGSILPEYEVNIQNLGGKKTWFFPTNHAVTFFLSKKHTIVSL